MFGRKNNDRKTCGSCEYFDCTSKSFKGVLDGNGYCRRMPPIGTKVISDRIYPENIITRKDEPACGEYKKGEGDA